MSGFLKIIVVNFAVVWGISAQIVDLRFNGNTKGASGTKVDGAVQGTVKYVEGLDGQAVEFDGSNQYINLGKPSELAFDENDNFSVAVWVKTEIDDSKLAIIASNSDYSEEWSSVFGGIYKFQRFHDGWTLYAREGSWG